MPAAASGPSKISLPGGEEAGAASEAASAAAPAAAEALLLLMPAAPAEQAGLRRCEAAEAPGPQGVAAQVGGSELLLLLVAAARRAEPAAGEPARLLLVEDRARPSRADAGRKRSDAPNGMNGGEQSVGLPLRRRGSAKSTSKDGSSSGIAPQGSKVQKSTRRSAAARQEGAHLLLARALAVLVVAKAPGIRKAS